MSTFDIVFKIIMCGILFNSVRGVIIGFNYFNNPYTEEMEEEEREIENTIHAGMIIREFVENKLPIRQ